MGQSVATLPTSAAIVRSSLIIITSLSGGRGATDPRPCSQLRAATGLLRQAPRLETAIDQLSPEPTEAKAEADFAWP